MKLTVIDCTAQQFEPDQSAQQAAVMMLEQAVAAMDARQRLHRARLDLRVSIMGLRENAPEHGARLDGIEEAADELLDAQRAYDAAQIEVHSHK